MPLPPVGSGYPLQVLARLRLPPGFPLLSLTQATLFRPYDVPSNRPHERPAQQYLAPKQFRKPFPKLSQEQKHFEKPFPELSQEQKQLRKDFPKLSQEQKQLRKDFPELYCARYDFVHCIRKAGYRHCERSEAIKAPCIRRIISFFAKKEKAAM
ncbi:MAG: hypothetical protein LBU37_07675, partial [Tannerellaceae bacterium]|nr:hypothetical protein [Tannerellaceae bacterium]